MTTDKAIEVANKIQLSNNPLWVEIKRLGEMYDRREAELYSTNHELFDEGVEYLRKITDLEKKNAELEASLLDVSEKTMKRMAKLEAQIEKMKCCGNCKYSNQESVYSIVCKVGGVDKSDYINIEDNQVCDKWEIKEND